MTRTLELLANAFPVWVLVACGLALVEPAWFTWFRGPAIVAGLAVIMLGMGITLSLADFARVAARPAAVATGFVAQFLIMPLAGWFVAATAGLETPFAVGIMLVAACPGGTASNVVTYIARADVALSVLMTTCSTLGAVVLTPLLVKLLAGRSFRFTVHDTGFEAYGTSTWDPLQRIVHGDVVWGPHYKGPGRRSGR